MYVFFPHIRTIVKPKKVQVSVTWEEGPGECETDGSWAAWPSWGGFSVKEAAQPLPPPAGPRALGRRPPESSAPHGAEPVAGFCNFFLCLLGEPLPCWLHSFLTLSSVLAHFSMSLVPLPPSLDSRFPRSFPPAVVIRQRARGQGRVSPWVPVPSASGLLELTAENTCSPHGLCLVLSYLYLSVDFSAPPPPDQECLGGSLGLGVSPSPAKG